MPLATGNSGISIPDLMTSAAEDISTPDGQLALSASSSKTSSGISDANAQNLITFSVNMAKALAGYKATSAAAQKASDALVEQRQAALRDTATQNEEAAAASAREMAQATGAALDTQGQNQTLKAAAGLDPNDPNSTLRRSIDDINLAAERHMALTDQAQTARENGKLTNLLFGDTTFNEFLGAHTTETPQMYKARAAVQADIVDTNAKRLADLQQVFSGQAAVNKAAETKLTLGSISDNATVAATEFSNKAADIKDKAIVAGVDNLKEVMQTAQQDSSRVISETMVQGQLIRDATTIDKMNQSLSAKGDPDSVAGSIRLAAKLIGVPGLTAIKGSDLRQYDNTPSMRATLNRLALVGATLHESAKLNPTAPLPQVFAGPGEAVDTLTTLKGQLPIGMEKVSVLLQKLEAGTDYSSGAGGTTPKLLKPLEKQAAIDANADRYYARNAKDMDGSDTYGAPPLNVVTAATSMNTEPAVAEFTSKILKPLAIGKAPVPAQLIISAALTSDLPLNTQVAGIVAYAKTARAVNDSLNNYQIVGLRPASTMPYTAVVKTPGTLFGGMKSVDLTDEKAVRDFLFHAVKFNGKGFSPVMGQVIGD